VLAVAGAGAKADPTRLSFVDLAESWVFELDRRRRPRSPSRFVHVCRTSDPLARSVRRSIRDALLLALTHSPTYSPYLPDAFVPQVRSRLKKFHDITTGIPVLMSTEKPRCGLVDAGDGDPGAELLDYQVVPNFRIRTIPVLGTTPSAFGMAAAGFVLCALAEQPIDPRPLFRLPERSLQTQYSRLETRLGRCVD
jgi:tRNA A37 threonylcarbamoyladenosine dehydratase